MDMSAVFLKVLNMSLTAGWLILAVVILRILLKNAPKWMTCSLWALVAFRLLCPFTIESPLSLLPSAEPVKEEILYAQEPVIESGVPLVDSVVNPVVSTVFAPDPMTSANPLQLWLFAGSVLWLAGIIVMLGYAGISYLRVRDKVGVSVSLRDNIRICDGISSPFILGVWKPFIFLPSNVADAQTKHVLAHEEAHLRRLDHWWKPLGFLLLSVYWFQPLCWLAYLLFCRDLELACDEKVIREFDLEEKKEYSKALLSCSVSHRRIAVCPLAFGEVGVRERIKAVLNYKKPAFWVVVLAAGACIAVAVCFLTSPPKEEAEIKAETSQTAEMKQTVEPEAVNEPINPETHLKLVEMEAFCPYYSLTFQKIEGGTGESIPFNTDEETGAGPNVECDPGYTGFNYWYDEPGMIRTLKIEFWLLSGEESVTVKVDDLEYIAELPQEEYREIPLNQKIEKAGKNAVIDTAKIYPSGLILNLSGVDMSQNEGMDYWFLLAEEDSEQLQMGGCLREPICDISSDKRELKYAFPSGFPADKTLLLRIAGEERDASGERIHEDYRLNLE